MSKFGDSFKCLLAEVVQIIILGCATRYLNTVLVTVLVGVIAMFFPTLSDFGGSSISCRGGPIPHQRLAEYNFIYNYLYIDI